MTPLPPWLADKSDRERREYVKLSGEYLRCKDEDVRLRLLNEQCRSTWNKSADWMYATLKAEMDLLVEALEKITLAARQADEGCELSSLIDFYMMEKNESIVALHKEKFG